MDTIDANTATIKYDILIEQSNGNGYTARLLVWPDCIVHSLTRENALQQMRTLIVERLAKAEVVTLEIPRREVAHSWLPFAGDWADDPLIEDFKAEIEKYRREIDAIHAPWLLEPEGQSEQQNHTS